MKRFFILFCFLLCSFLGYSVYTWGLHEISGNTTNTERLPIEIPKGSTLSQISETLAHKKIISSSELFLRYTQWKHPDILLQAGSYLLSPASPYESIIQELQNAKQTEFPVRIPEGTTLAGIDAILSKHGLIQAGEFIECTKNCTLPFEQSDTMLEGYFFPDTYYVHRDTFSITGFMERLHNTLTQKLSDSHIQSALTKSKYSLHEIITMASLIEREEHSIQNRSTISGILWKRLEERMPLGVDATTRYELNKWNQPLYTKDFTSDSPFNTRRQLGLPPHAIGAPSLNAIEAALFPEESPYYYYLHDNTGRIHYAETYEKHLINKNTYL